MCPNIYIYIYIIFFLGAKKCNQLNSVKVASIMLYLLYQSGKRAIIAIAECPLLQDSFKKRLHGRDFQLCFVFSHIFVLHPQTTKGKKPFLILSCICNDSHEKFLYFKGGLRRLSFNFKTEIIILSHQLSSQEFCSIRYCSI